MVILPENDERPSQQWAIELLWAALNASPFTQLLLSGASTALLSPEYFLSAPPLPYDVIYPSASDPVTHVQIVESDALAAHERSCTRQLSAFAKSDFTMCATATETKPASASTCCGDRGSSQDCWKARIKCIVWRRTTHLFTVRPLWLSLFFSYIPIRH